MVYVISVLASLFVVFILHFIVSKVVNSTLKNFYKFYFSDESLGYYLIFTSLLLFTVMMVTSIALYNTHWV